MSLSPEHHGSVWSLAGAVAAASLLLLVAPPAPAASLSGTLSCDDCTGITLVLRDAMSVPIAAQWWASAGPWSLDVQDDLGAVWLSAMRDADANGQPDPGTVPVDAPANPITVGTAEVTGIDLSLPALSPTSVQLSGTVACAGCAGVLLRVRDAGSGAVERDLSVDPGPFSVSLPAELGAVDLSAARDEDGDGSPDPGAPFFEAPGNPYLVGVTDVTGVAITIAPPAADSVTLSGAISCGDCAGLTLSVSRDAARAEVLVERWAAGPGAFSVTVPADSGDLYLAVFRDADADGAPDVGAAVVASPDNPVAVATADVDGLTLDIPPLAGSVVTLHGTVDCPGCGVVTVGVRGASAPHTLWAVVGASADGAWSVSLAEGIGPVEVFAFQDDDSDGTPDPGGALAEAPDNPYLIGSEDVGPVAVVFAPAPEGVTLSGTIACADCAGALVLVVRGPLGQVDHELERLSLVAPGPYALSLPVGLSEVTVFAARDGDEDGLADPPQPLTPAPDNPITVGVEDVSGVDIGLPPLGVPDTVRLAGTVTCVDCGGAVVVQLLDDPSGSPLAERSFDGPGAWSIEIAAPPQGQTRSLRAAAFADADGDGQPDGPVGSYAANPLTLGGSDLAGVDIEIPSQLSPAVTLSGEVTCPSCAGGGLVVELRAAGGDALRSLWLAAPGPWSVTLSPQTGGVVLTGYADADGDGIADVDGATGAYVGNPIHVGAADLDGLDLALTVPAAAATLTLSGEVLCPRCEGAVSLRLSSAASGTLRAWSVGAPGAWSAEVPAGIGDVSLFGYADADGDGIPDLGSTPTPYPENPITLADADVVGLDFTIDPSYAAAEADAGGGDVGDVGAAGGDVGDAEDIDADVFDADSVAPDAAGGDALDAGADVPSGALEGGAEDGGGGRGGCGGCSSATRGLGDGPVDLGVLLFSLIMALFFGLFHRTATRRQ